MREPALPVPKEDRTWRALAVAVLGSIGAYAVLALILLGVLWAVAGDLSRDAFWRWVIFMLVFMIPQVLAPWIGIKIANLTARPYRRRLVYVIFCALILIVFIAFTVGFLYGGEWRGILLTALQAVASFLAWRVARGAIGIGRPPVPPPAIR